MTKSISHKIESLAYAFCLLLTVLFFCACSSDEPRVTEKPVELGTYLLNAHKGGKSIWNVANHEIKFDDFSSGNGWIFDRTIFEELKIILPDTSNLAINYARIYVESHYYEEIVIDELRLEKGENLSYNCKENYEFGLYKLYHLGKVSVKFYGQKLVYRPIYFKGPEDFNQYLRIIFNNGLELVYRYDSKDDILCPFLYSYGNKTFFVKKEPLESHGEHKFDGEQETWLHKKFVKIFTELVLFVIIYIIVCIVICIISGPEVLLTTPISAITSFILFFVWIFFIL